MYKSIASNSGTLHCEMIAHLWWVSIEYFSFYATLCGKTDENTGNDCNAPPINFSKITFYFFLSWVLNLIKIRLGWSGTVHTKPPSASSFESISSFYSGFPKETPELKFRLRFFFRSATVCNSLINTHARRVYWWAHGVMADGEEFMRWKISTNTVDGYKTDTKCAHSVHGRPTLKDEERFRNGLVRKPYERSLYERTFCIYEWTLHRETCYINWVM